MPVIAKLINAILNVKWYKSELIHVECPVWILQLSIPRLKIY